MAVFRPLAMLLGLLLGSQASADSPAPLRLCYESSPFSPYLNGSQQVPARNPGLILEHLVMPAAREAGLELELHGLPTKRCILEVQQNRTDALLASIWQPEREQWGRFPGEPGKVDRRYRLWQAEFAIIVSPDSPLTWDGQRFQHMRHGLSAPLGFVIHKRLEQLGVLYPGSLSQESALRMIPQGRLDGFVIERLVALDLIGRSERPEQYRLLPQAFMRDDWYIPFSHGFHRQHPQRVERFWQALAERRERVEADLQNLLAQEVQQR